MYTKRKLKAKLRPTRDNHYFFDSSSIVRFDLTKLKLWRASINSFSNCFGLVVYSYATAVNATEVNDNVTIIPAKRKLLRKYFKNDII